MRMLGCRAAPPEAVAVAGADAAAAISRTTTAEDEKRAGQGRREGAAG